MKKLLLLLSVPLLVLSCRARKTVVQDTIPYVKQLSVDTTGTFGLVRAYRDAGTEGSIALLGEPEAAFRLAAEFLSADRADNIDGKPTPDLLPDFAGESFDVVMDLYNAPYRRLAAASPDSLREVAVRSAVMAVDSVAYPNALGGNTRLRKSRAKVFVLASSLTARYGRFDIDTLFRMAGREPLILTPVEALLDAAAAQGCRRVAVWASEESASYYDSIARIRVPQAEVTVVPAETGPDLRLAFREMLRRFRSLRPQAALDAVLLDDFTADRSDLEAELERIHRQISEEDMAFDRILSPGFRFIEPAPSLASACYRLLRERNLFTHNIAYPYARYYQTEENQDGGYVLVEVAYDYIASRQSLSAHVPDID